MSRKICSLERDEVVALEDHGQRPNCRHHYHRKLREAENLVEDGRAYWVGEDHTAIFVPHEKRWAKVTQTIKGERIGTTGMQMVRY